jgi:transposase
VETIVQRPAALDVHKELTACVRVPDGAGGREQHVVEFATTVGALLTLRDWLARFGVTRVTIEAAGVFWKPVWAVLEDEFELLLVNARHVKQVPGRKSEVSDAAWQCQLAEAGLLRASFVPPKPIRALRNLNRYRKTQIQERAREANRLHKALEDTGIKLDCVATNILGKSGRAMLDALVGGTTDPEVLADLARGRLRAKIPALREALEGRFDHLHAVWIGAILNHLDFLDEQISSLTDAIGEQIIPFEKAVELLCTIPGVQRRTAECIIAEIGTDMSVFSTAKHLASWAGQMPRQRKIRWQAPLRQDAQRLQVAVEGRADRACVGAVGGQVPQRVVDGRRVARTCDRWSPRDLVLLSCRSQPLVGGVSVGGAGGRSERVPGVAGGDRLPRLPKAVYVDNGSPFVSGQLLRACAVLGIRLIHSRPGRPEGGERLSGRFERSASSCWLSSRTARLAAWKT